MLLPRLKAPTTGGLLGATPVVFSEQSKKKMAGVNPLLADMMTEVERRALAAGIKLEVSEGLRTPDRQKGLVAGGKSQTLNSKHITGNALDVHVVGPDGKPNWDFEAYRPVADIAKQVAAEKGIPDFVWGGDWKTLKDGVHFQVGGPSRPSGQGGGTVVASTKGQEGLLNSPAPVEEKKRGLLGFLSDPDKRAQLAIALEGMTLNPNTALMGMLGEGVKDRSTTKKTAESTNKTVAWLRSIGQDQLANALETGAVDPGAVVGQAIQAMQPKPPAQPIEVGGVLLDPVTLQPIFDSRQAGGGDAFTLGTGQVRYDAFGNKIAEGPAAPPPDPSVPVTKVIKQADGSEAMIQWNPQTQVWDQAQLPQGGTLATGAPTAKLTEMQAKTTLFETLQVETAPVIEQIEGIWSPANLGDAIARSTPIAGNFFTSEEGQLYASASSAWAEGALRISTGAAATEPEIQRIQKTYFASPGDTPVVIEFKRGMREMYSRAISASLGKDVSGSGKLVLPDEFAKKYMAIAKPPAGMPATGGPVVKKYDPATGAYK